MNSGKCGMKLAADAAALARPNLTFSVVAMDRSGSMKMFGKAPKDALNGLVSRLKAGPTAPNIWGAIYAFADEERPTEVVALQPVSHMPVIDKLNPDGGTRLYGSVLLIMQDLMRVYAEAKAMDVKPNIIFTVCTDGGDTCSKDKQPELMRLSGQALEMGWDLCVFGFGVDAHCIAENMGFPPDATHAVTLEPRAESVQASMRSVTHRTETTSMGMNWQQSPPNRKPVTVSVKEDTQPPSTPR